MYQVGGWLAHLRERRRLDPGPAPLSRVIPANVVFLGLTSLLTDISSEMVVAILPVYLIGFLRLSPTQFGVVDGLYQGVSGVVQLASAVVTDRLRRYKEMAGLGYAASACCRVGLLITTSWTGITALLTLDRLGKGLRSAPRDALISLSVQTERLGVAFGVHRAMDSVGAMVGPMVAFAILSAIVDGFHVVFIVSLCAAVVGLAVLGFFVENRDPGVGGAGGAGGAGGTDALNRTPAADFWKLFREPRMRHLAVSAFLLSATTISDAFVYLMLQRRTQLSIGGFPLLYVGTSASYLVFAVPMGRLADRVGRFPVFIAGYLLLTALYAALLSSYAGTWLPFATILILGLHYAATEGVLMALGSAVIPSQIRTTGLAGLTTATAVAQFISSVTFGFSWTQFGLPLTVSVFGAGLVIAVVASVLLLPRSPSVEAAV
jgi:MFS family permease